MDAGDFGFGAGTLFEFGSGTRKFAIVWYTKSDQVPERSQYSDARGCAGMDQGSKLSGARIFRVLTESD